MRRYATPGQQLRYHTAQRPAPEPVPAGKPLLLVWCDLLVACLRLCPAGSMVCGGVVCLEAWLLSIIAGRNSKLGDWS